MQDCENTRLTFFFASPRLVTRPTLQCVLNASGRGSYLELFKFCDTCSDAICKTKQHTNRDLTTSFIALQKNRGYKTHNLWKKQDSDNPEIKKEKKWGILVIDGAFATPYNRAIIFSFRQVVYLSHTFHSIPSGGLQSTCFCLTSSQFVLKTVPPDSTNDLFMAFLTSSLPSP